MHIDKVSITPPKGKHGWKVRVEWTESRLVPAGLAIDARTVTSDEPPHPDFVAALAALRRPVVDACLLARECVDDETGEMDDDALTDVLVDLAVRGVSFREMDDGEGDPVPAVVITALRTLDWSAASLVLNTPLAPVGAVPTDGLASLLDALRVQAEAYVGGRRAQASLFEPED